MTGSRQFATAAGIAVLGVSGLALGLWWTKHQGGLPGPASSRSAGPGPAALLDVQWSCRVDPPGLAVRAQPDGQAAVLGWLGEGQDVVAVARTAEADWLAVRSGDLAGWVSHAQLRCAEDLPIWSADAGATPEPPPLLASPVPPTSRPPEPDGSFIAYRVSAPLVGNQDHAGPLGMNFDVISPIVVTHLGVFDSGQDGLRSPVRAILWDRDSRTVLAELRFRDQDGELVEASRFMPLAEPVQLPAGFQGTMGAEGYSVAERNGNGIGGPVPWTMDDGGGLIRFVGPSLWDWPWFLGQFPSIEDSGPANRYAAGTFRFRPAP